MSAKDAALVLVVEDDPIANATLCDILEKDYRVAAAFDGRAGLESALELRPDAVITDMTMPEMTGEQLVRAMRARPELATTPVVVLTAKTDADLRARLLREGAHDYLTKPFSAEELRARLSNVIAVKRSFDVKARLASLVEQAPDGIFVADLEGRYVEVNAAACRLLGHAREELIGKTIVDLIPPGTAERLAREKEVLLGGATHVSEWTLRRKDGTYVPVEVSAKILSDGRWQAVVRDLTERKRARDLVRESQERFDLALRGADLGAWDWNVQTGEVVFNTRWAEMRGYRLDEIAPRVESWSSGVHPEDWARIEKGLRDHFEGRSPLYDIEHRVRTKAGDWIWILDRGRVFTRDEQGRPVRMVGTELDITERKRLEEELRASEAKFSGIVSSSLDAIVSVDEQFRITLFNGGAEEVFGWTSAEVLGKPLEMLVPEHLRALHVRAAKAFAEGPEVARRLLGRDGTVTGLRRSGEEFPAEASISKLELAGRRIFTVTLRDITRRKRIETEQRFLAEAGSVLASPLDYEETLANVAELAVRYVADTCVIDVVEEDRSIHPLPVATRDPSRRAACDALARVAREAGGTPLFRIVLESERPFVMERVSPEELRALARSEEHARALLGIEPRSIVGVPLLAHGKLLGAMALVSSAPGRSYGADDVRLAEELARRSALAIENARLYREARRAVQARDDVLGVVAHDVRNPLGSILMRASLLRSKHPDAAGPALAIEEAAARIDRLIEDLLDVTRLEAGRLSIEPRAISATQLVQDCAEAQKLLARSASLALETDVSPDLPDVWADRDRLLQVFENLIGNAAKFTKSGGTITVGAAPREGEVHFRVADTGAGIAPEDLPRVFDRFWQAGTEERHRGAGLGLAIVKGIVEAHGGRTWVESTKGRGTTFFFTIPVAASARAAA